MILVHHERFVEETTWNTRTLRVAGKLQELTYEMDRFRWDILESGKYHDRRLRRS